MKCNRHQIADILGITVVTVTAWVEKDGMPYTRAGAKGVPWEFDSVPVIAWYAATKFRTRDRRSAAHDDPFSEPGASGETIEGAQLRKESALADRHEITAATAAGLLVPIEEVAAVVLQENSRARARILSIPNELRPTFLVHLNNDRKAAEACVAQVEATIHEAFADVVNSVEQAVSDEPPDDE